PISRRSLNFPARPLSHSLHIDGPAPGYLAFGPNSATFRNLFFQNEAFLPLSRSLCRPVCLRGGGTSDAGKIRRRAGGGIGGPAPGRRPLYPSAAERRSLPEVSAHLPRVARFQPSVLDPTGRRYAEREVRDL